MEPSSPQDLDRILTVSEVASELRCSKAHVYKAINGLVPGVSSLPAIFLGRRKLVRRRSLEQWKLVNERAAGDPVATDDAIMIASRKVHAGDAWVRDTEVQTDAVSFLWHET